MIQRVELRDRWGAPVGTHEYTVGANMIEARKDARDSLLHPTLTEEPYLMAWAYASGRSAHPVRQRHEGPPSSPLSPLFPPLAVAGTRQPEVDGVPKAGLFSSEGSVAMSTYVRARGGRMVHRTTCRFANSKSAIPWNWAAGKTPWEIMRECLAHGVNVYQGSCCMAMTQIEPT